MNQIEKMTLWIFAGFDWLRSDVVSGVKEFLFFLFFFFFLLSVSEWTVRLSLATSVFKLITEMCTQATCSIRLNAVRCVFILIVVVVVIAVVVVAWLVYLQSNGGENSRKAITHKHFRSSENVRRMMCVLWCCLSQLGDEVSERESSLRQ